MDNSINKKVFIENSDEYKAKILKSIEKCVKLKLMLAENKVTWEELFEFLPEILEIKDSIENPSFTPFIYSLKRNDKGVLVFTKQPADNEFRKLININNNLWLTDIFPVNTKLTTQRMIINSRSKIELELRCNMIKESLLNKSNISFKGFYVHGKYSTSKTQFAHAIATEWAKSGVTTVYMTTQALFNYLKSSFDSNRHEGAEIIQKLKDVDALIIDDLGGESPNAWFIFEILNDIITHRINLNKNTNFLSAMSYEKLNNYYINHRSLKSEAHKANVLIQKIESITLPFEID
ncbi:ATP-binding protein [Mycoplasma miroungigenitalium]|uniref:ATP-binding protein n=1 Tax=Mycoplasma miroungigenitalium TaxID=754515 RepID=A0A6M4JBZ4_9MOLU|nr:ATP-binding protein [Mycoplasma miroungigenitalium]QJR43607.1 ATP-binding protein [Mycoplasma miroungigenitalium]